MKWLQALQQKISKHRYAINAEILGDKAECAWTNLGFWTEITDSYPQACQQLAQQLAEAVCLKRSDRILDLACGHGASLKYWLEHYQIEYIEAVELQAQCVAQIREQFPQIHAVHCQSFLDIQSNSNLQTFDVVLCIDAAYHAELNDFLSAVSTVLKPYGRIGFHYLMLSNTPLSLVQKFKYTNLLKVADVRLNHVMTEQQLHQTLVQHGFGDICIRNISAPVLSGFSHYIEKRKIHGYGLDQMKIKMTAKLCNTLFSEGLVQYIQVSAKKMKKYNV